MNPDKIWAHCTRCKSTERFVRVPMNHRLHAVLAVLTLGLWTVSWLALTISNKFWPWQCKKCGSNQLDLSSIASQESAPSTKRT